MSEQRPDYGEKKPPLAESLLKTLTEEFEPASNINESDLRLTTAQIVDRIYGNEAPETGGHQYVHYTLQKEGYKLVPEGSGDDVQFIWLFKNRK